MLHKQRLPSIYTITSAIVFAAFSCGGNTIYVHGSPSVTAAFLTPVFHSKNSIRSKDSHSDVPQRTRKETQPFSLQYYRFRTQQQQQIFFHKANYRALKMAFPNNGDENINEDEDDEEDVDDTEDPLALGVDSVHWLPSALNQETKIVSAVRNGAQIFPLFPLGGIVYTPNSEHVLNIFEPRYRQMYNDIIMNGSKRFIVSMSHPTKEGTFAETGVIFQLSDLKEVSEMTGDQIKYICQHRVVGRVKLHRILNPEAWKTRDTYLRVEATVIQEPSEDPVLPDSVTPTNPLSSMSVSDTTSDIYRDLVKMAKSKEEKALLKSFGDLVTMQHDLEEDVRFTRASITTLAVAPGDGQDGLWQSVRLWQSFIEQRLVAAQNDMQSEFQTKLLEFLKKDKGMSDSEIPNAIGFNDLSPSLQKEVQDLQRRMQVELQPLVLESILTIQKILEAENHTARLILLRHFVESERKRLSAKSTLKGMFKKVMSSDTSTSQNISKVTNSANDDVKNDSASKRSIFADEEDAFQ